MEGLETRPNYKIVQKLGSGGFGKVYKIIDTKDNIVYALKKIELDSELEKTKIRVENESNTLSSINNPNIVENKINSADIIYIGGGDTIKLLNYVKEYNIDKLLNKVKEKDIVIAGISAGAIILSKEGYSDSYILRGEKDKHEFIKGLNFIDIVISPHYDKASDKTKELLKDIGNRKVYCISNGAALIIKDNKIDIIKSKKDAIVKTY